MPNCYRCEQRPGTVEGVGEVRDPESPTGRKKMKMTLCRWCAETCMSVVDVLMRCGMSSSGPDWRGPPDPGCYRTDPVWYDNR
jgi:hypothetical protein